MEPNSDNYEPIEEEDFDEDQYQAKSRDEYQKSLQTAWDEFRKLHSDEVREIIDATWKQMHAIRIGDHSSLSASAYNRDKIARIERDIKAKKFLEDQIQQKNIPHEFLPFFQKETSTDRESRGEEIELLVRKSIGLVDLPGNREEQYARLDEVENKLYALLSSLGYKIRY